MLRMCYIDSRTVILFSCTRRGLKLVMYLFKKTLTIAYLLVCRYVLLDQGMPYYILLDHSAVNVNHIHMS